MTAEEFYRLNHDKDNNVPQAMIDFAKYHVEQCKKAFLQSETFTIKDEWGTIEDSVILDYYPLNNIK